MNLLTILLLLSLSFSLGVIFIEFLTSHPLKMNVYLSLFWINLFSVIILFILNLSSDLFLSGVISFIILLLFLVGYGIMTRRILSMEDPRYIPNITRMKDKSGNGHTAIVYFAHGEPETYNPIGWINQFKELDEHNVPFIPRLIRPFFLYQLRKKYLQVGKSDHRKMHQIMFNDLKESFDMETNSTMKFYLSFLDDEPRPDAAVIKALNEGANHIIVCEVFVSISNHTLEGEELIKRLAVQDYDVQLDFTTPLWNSIFLHKMFLHKANENLATINKSKVGVLLVGHGQPKEWDSLFPSASEHEIVFREKIVNQFINNGYRKENIYLAWMEFRDPKPAQMIEKMISNGVEKILFYSASISADAIHSMYDIPELVEEAKIPENIEVINLGAWNNHPLVIQALKEKINEFI